MLLVWVCVAVWRDIGVPLLQDWFSSQLKQVVFQLSGSTDSTDGAGMSSPSPHGNFASVDFLELME